MTCCCVGSIGVIVAAIVLGIAHSQDMAHTISTPAPGPVAPPLQLPMFPEERKAARPDVDWDAPTEIIPAVDKD